MMFKHHQIQTLVSIFNFNRNHFFFLVILYSVGVIMKLKYDHIYVTMMTYCYAIYYTY